jgi:polyisoprenoid-binding protein YceI
MKKKSLLLAIGILTAVGIAIYGCTQRSREATTGSSTAAASLDGSGITYLVDTTASLIEWTGSTPTHFKHTGNLKLKNGKFTANQNHLTGGTFVINIRSINNTGQTGEDKGDLEKHLRDTDFFEAAKFPFGQFEVTQTRTDSSGQKVIGNLTLKGKTNTIEIPVSLHIGEQRITAESAEFAIDRTRWGIVYQSGVIGTLKDDLISDDVLIKLKLVATRQP